MAEFTDYLEDRILNHIFRATASTAPATVYLALHTAVNSDTTPGTAVTLGGYARQAITFSAPSPAGAITNSADVQFTASGAAYGTVVSTSIYDALTTGNQLCFDNDFTDTAVADGETLKFVAGDIDVTLT